MTEHERQTQSESQFARFEQLVRQAQAEPAPQVNIADTALRTIREQLASRQSAHSRDLEWAVACTSLAASVLAWLAWSNSVLFYEPYELALLPLLGLVL